MGDFVRQFFHRTPGDGDVDDGVPEALEREDEAGGVG